MINIVIFAFSSLPLLLGLHNVALGKPTRQISKMNTATAASYAVDGDTDGILSHGSCSSTGDEPNMWWEVDLLGFYTIYSVEIFRRTDCSLCVTYLQDFEVRLSSINSTEFPRDEGQQCVYQNSTIPAFGAMLTCTRPVTGRYVIVFKPVNHHLTLCEVRVFGERLRFTVSSEGFYRISSHNTRAIVPSMSSFSAPSLVACAIQCTQDSLCFAFNFMKIPSGTLSTSVTCELLKYDTFNKFQDLIPMLQQKVNWTVYFLTL